MNEGRNEIRERRKIRKKKEEERMNEGMKYEMNGGRKGMYEWFNKGR